MYQKSSFVY
ncbi:hypothetical protein RDI58_010747 [Solanum bulbocastanum]|uniref:Uncharacterized protein n=1 Tax=Solanum bulbocastanum TaxID=147425 RepID=A0AAN8YH20_SOLBU